MYAIYICDTLDATCATEQSALNIYIALSKFIPENVLSIKKIK